MKEKTVSATFRLLKENVSKDDAIIGEHKLVQQKLSDKSKSNEIIIYAGQVYSSQPEWIDFIASASAENPELKNMGAAAVIFVAVKNRWFAVSFGMAQICLDRDAFETDFGLKVCLNAIPREKIKTIDIASPDTVTLQKRTQANMESDLSLFNIDIEKDILRLLSGKPENKLFATSMSGRDSLQMTCKLSIKLLQSKCEELLSFYKSDYYKKVYPWIDHIRQIRDVDLLTQLGNKLDDAVRSEFSKAPQDIILSIPEILDPAADYIYRYNGMPRHSRKYKILFWGDYLSELSRQGNEGEIEKYNEHIVSMISPGFPVKKYYVKECINFETTIDDKKYIIWNGAWYEIDPVFATEVESTWRRANIVSEYLLNDTDKKNEAELIENLTSSHQDWQNFDQEKINPTNTSYAFIEPCDFFVPGKKFFHLKDGISSANISHLWNQGLVSGECFLADAEFRDKFKSKLRDSLKDQVPRRKDSIPKTNEYSIVFGIMRSPLANENISIPFFSKVSFKSVYQRLTILGFKVFVNPIKKV